MKRENRQIRKEIRIIVKLIVALEELEDVTTLEKVQRAVTVLKAYDIGVMEIDRILREVCKAKTTHIAKARGVGRKYLGCYDKRIKNRYRKALKLGILFDAEEYMYEDI